MRNIKLRFLGFWSSGEFFRRFICNALVIVFLLGGMGSSAYAGIQKFSASDCNELISETKLSELLGYETHYGFKKESSKPTDVLGKEIAGTADFPRGARCQFHGPATGGSSILKDLPLFTGEIDIYVELVQLTFDTFTSKNAANLKQLSQKVMWENTDIGKGTSYVLGDVGILKAEVIHFLDDDTDCYARVSVSYATKPIKDQGIDLGLEPKLKAIAAEIEKNIK